MPWYVVVPITLPIVVMIAAMGWVMWRGEEGGF